MLIDLHTHTMRHSIDSGLSLETLLTTARERGLDGVCLTEHNSLWRPEDLVGLAERHGLLVLRGMEVATDIGHVLVFGVSGYTPEMMFFHRLRHIVEGEGGAMVLAHPWRETSSKRLSWSEVQACFDAVEVFNGSDTNGSNEYVARMVAEMGMVGVGGSDAHSKGGIGTFATRFDVIVQTEADLVAAIQEGCVQAVRVREIGANTLK